MRNVPVQLGRLPAFNESIFRTGHMVHQTATGEIMRAIDLVASQIRKPVAVTSAA